MIVAVEQLEQRDALLPKLLSGELRVAEIKEVVHNPERQTV